MLTYKYIHLSTHTIIILTSERPSANFQKEWEHSFTQRLTYPTCSFIS